jgi:phosphohistidine phosphatase
MKTVFFVRHAKSSWGNPSVSDMDRPLNERGLRDAPQMGLKLKQLNSNIDLIVSSPAKRAFTTATFFAAALGLPPEKIVLEPRLYEAMSEDVISVINDLSDEYHVVAIFGHNPTFTFIANLFTEDYIDNIPTCGVCQVDARINSWKEFGENSGRLSAFYYPKQSLL